MSAGITTAAQQPVCALDAHPTGAYVDGMARRNLISEYIAKHPENTVWTPETGWADHHDIETCLDGSDITCPDCVSGGIIQTTDCDTCGACRWVHSHDGTTYNPTTGHAVR